MEEDIEIERLYKEHGPLLMEAAAAEHVDSENEKSTICEENEEEKVQIVEYGTASTGKKTGKRKWTSKHNRPKRQKFVARKAATVEDDDSATDFEEILDARIVSFIADGGMKSSLNPDDEFYTRFSGTICEDNKGEKVKCVENDTASTGKKTGKRKWTGKHNRRKRQKYVSRKAATVEDDDSATDFEELLDARIVSFIADGGMKSSLNPDDEFYTGFGGKSCINEILDDKYVSREKSSEFERKQVENTSSENSNNRLILELKSLRNMIDKREDMLIKLERELMEELYQNESEQRRVREAKKALSVKEPSNPREPKFTKFYFKHFGIPYFHDSSGFPAPSNNDVKKKLKNGELVITTVPRLKYWRKCEKDKLQDAIQVTLIKENSEKLTKQVAKLKGKLKKVDDEQTEKEILDKIVEHQKLLKKIKSMSYLDLLANENPDREYDWLMYSASELNGTFSADDCKRFWHLYLKPTINKARWEISEDETLKELAEEMNFQDWEKIAQSLNTNRTAYQCLIHYRNRLCDKQDFVVGKWTKEEDEKLLNVINSSKVGDFIPWTKVATFMGDRTHNQIYNRYVNSLDPKLVKGRFTMEEDVLIVSGIEVFGVTYKEMASLMKSRTPNQIRERYERHLLPKTAKTGTFSLEEDELLLKLVDKHGERNFALVAEEMKTRTRTQIRQRYNTMMEMMRTKPGWTPAQVKRRSVHNVSKSLTRTQKKVELIKKEVEEVEKKFVLTNLERDTFRIEKLKELCDKMFMKKYDLKQLKKKTITEHTDINNQLLEFFKYQHSPVNSSIRQNSVNNMAYLNEMILLAKYFGHDLQLPESEDEIWQNNNLSYNLKAFLVETLKQHAVRSKPLKTACEKPNTIELSSTTVEEANNMDYVEPEVDNTLIMEEFWHNASFCVSNLNFSEIFKRTVFDYSHGMHQDIWDSKMIRSKNVVFYDFDIAKPQYDQQYFFPPNSITTLGYKSVLLSKTRLKRDANKLLNEQSEIKTNSETYHLQDEFQETLLSLFYCPKVLSVTDISSTLLPPVKKIKTSVGVSNREKLVHLLNSSNQSSSDIVKKVTKPIKDDTLREKTVKRSILEHNKTRQRQLQEFKMGITYNRKMKIEHLVKSVRKRKQNYFSIRNSLKRKLKTLNAKREATELNNRSSILKTNGSQATKIRVMNQFDSKLYSSVPVVKIPVMTYSRTQQSLKQHSEPEKPSEPAIKKSNFTNSGSTKSTPSRTGKADKISVESISRATVIKNHQ